MTTMEDDHNGRWPQWKTTSMEDNLNGRQRTSIEQDFNGRWPQWKTTSIEDNLYGRQPRWKTTLMEDNLNGRRPQWKKNVNGGWPQWKKTLRKPYMKMTLACLVSQICTELGPAQPQLVSQFCQVFSHKLLIACSRQLFPANSCEILKNYAVEVYLFRVFQRHFTFFHKLALLEPLIFDLLHLYCNSVQIWFWLT